MSEIRLLSHPPDDDHPQGRPLAQHLDEVDRIAGMILSRHPPEAFAAAGLDVRAVLHALSGWHDLGKGTVFFQDYIADPEAFNRRAAAGDPNAEPHLKDHTPIGAFLAVRHFSRQSRGSE
jgi:hypothetical protein